MKLRFLAVACFVLIACLSSFSTSASNAKLLGTWGGESKCTAADSACRDEHVIYRIATIKHMPGKLALHGYRVQKGQLIFMGTLECVHTDQDMLICTGNAARKDTWEFKVVGRTMTGTLTRGEEKLPYRKVSVRKK
jgi:hypothetical protein